MSETQIQDLDRRLTALTQEVNSLKAQVGVVGTTQYAVVQILDRLERVETTQAQHSNQLDNLQVNVNEILRILRDVSRQAALRLRNGGSGL
jgi:ABC-type transporter Mla subunit MlaD